MRTTVALMDELGFGNGTHTMPPRRQLHVWLSDEDYEYLSANAAARDRAGGRDCPSSDPPTEAEFYPRGH
ncbi:MAG: hypothetical protein AB1806_04625 [Acidobacteriota bacterium]